MGRKRPLDELDPRHALAAGRGHASLRWAERKERENAAWDSRWPVDRELWIAATLQRQAAEAELRSAQECVVQQLLSTAVPQLCSCRQSDNRLLGDDCVMVATGEVEHAAYFGQGSVVCEVTVPVYRCTAVTHTRTHIISLPRAPPHPLPPAGCAGLGEDALAAAAPERAAAAEAASGSANRRGPAGTLCLQGWFECASLLGVFSLMPPPPSFLLAVCLDGNSKFMRFAVGEAQSEERPKVLTFMAKTGLVVMEDHQSGLLSSAAQQAWLLSEGGKPCGGSCASTLTANRPTAAQQGLLALYGVAGLFCPHGMLGRDCIVPMPTPEQHAFHLRNLLSFISRRPDLRDIYLDIACRIKKSMQAQLQAEVAAGNLPADVLEVGGVNEVLGVGWLGGPACEILYPTQKRWSFICRL